MRYDFAKKIDDLLMNERRTKKSLYDHLQMTGTGFDAMMKNNSFSAVRLAAIADFFSIPVAELYGEVAPMRDKSVIADNEDKYLQDHLAALEQNFEKLLEQLSVKDRQIDNLQDMLKMVLGKSKGATNTQLFGQDDAFDIDFDRYRFTALQHISGVLAPQSVSMPRQGW